MSATTESERPTLTRAASIVAHDGRHLGDAVVPPIFQTSLFTFPTYQDMSDRFAGLTSRDVYSRVTNPTVRAFEEKIAALENAEDAVGFASGMAAISSAVLAFIRPGDRLVAVRHLYPDAYRFFETFLKAMNVSVEYVDGGDLEAMAARLPGCRVLYLESPTSWMMQSLDVAGLAKLARAHGAISIIDNSWATPIFQRPIDLGCDIVVHSASKYIGGHSDVVAGVAAGSTALIKKLRGEILPYLGAKLAPMDAWLLLRGLRTLPYRIVAHEKSALALAKRLIEHPSVTRVHHPGLGNALPAGLMGTTGLFSIELAEDIDIPAFCDTVKLFKLGVSWGGHESLICPAGVARVQAGGPNHAEFFEVPPRMARINTGLEATDDLWDDLTNALETSKKPNGRKS